MPNTVFISDMHLSEETPKLNQLMLKKLEQWRGCIDRLYLLGDIFDVWVGDDDYTPAKYEVIQALHHFSQATPLYVMRGNRDFLLGRRFLRASGATLLRDPSVITLYGKKYILTHGDILCTDDVEYQKFRSKIRHPLVKFLLLCKSLEKRRALAQKIRHISAQKKGNRQQYAISDVTEAGLNAVQKKCSGSLALDVIHGHTHRPNVHSHIYCDQAFYRFVIPDWHDNMGGAWFFFDDGHSEQVAFSI